jgi:hypothetical protein
VGVGAGVVGSGCWLAIACADVDAGIADTVGSGVSCAAVPRAVGGSGMPNISNAQELKRELKSMTSVG